jgi:DNA-binding CsgD family transcriptional regulator
MSASLNWTNLDWTRSNAQIAVIVGTSPGMVANKRRILGQAKLKPGPRPTIRKVFVPTITQMLRRGVSKKQIALQLGVHPLTLTRNLRGVPGCSQAELLAFREAERDAQANRRVEEELRRRESLKQSMRQAGQKAPLPHEAMEPKDKARERLRNFLETLG